MPKNYFNCIKKYITYLVLIYQNLNNTKYGTKILYIIAYFKKI